MRRALDEARKGVGRTSPNPPVGAVVVKGGVEIGAGWHRGAGLPHAEREAMAAARGGHGAEALRGANPAEYIRRSVAAMGAHVLVRGQHHVGLGAGSRAVVDCKQLSHRRPP